MTEMLGKYNHTSGCCFNEDNKGSLANQIIMLKEQLEED